MSQHFLWVRIPLTPPNSFRKELIKCKLTVQKKRKVADVALSRRLTLDQVSVSIIANLSMQIQFVVVCAKLHGVITKKKQRLVMEKHKIDDSFLLITHFILIAFSVSVLIYAFCFCQLVHEATNSVVELNSKDL